jgi:hypothetical protein
MLMDASKEAEEERVAIVAPQNADPNAFYWSERMDAQLARCVHALDFDFDEVSRRLREELGEADLDGVDKEKLTVDAVRDRWCELDLDDGEGAAPVEGGVGAAVKSKIMVGENGKQMSFAELQRSVNAQGSSLLKAPKLEEGLGALGGADSDEDSDEGFVSAADMRAKMKAKMTDFEVLD